MMTQTPGTISAERERDPLLLTNSLVSSQQTPPKGSSSRLQSRSDFPYTVMMGLSEVEPPSPIRYIIGAAIMMIGVVLPVGYMMLRNKRVPSSSSYSKQT
ncbi:hypothetical protein TIFTF001_003131 [Ficus carica]|uniref:Uncharacterized protein n=1 Tax=Ficus carica TaxID=3494 RepID=A0AA87Z6S2_FICCA|nr:hypothetical protein TIFTF001_003131 [Ficus carica]